MRKNERKFVKEHEKEDHTLLKRSDTRRNRNEKIERKRGNESIKDIPKAIMNLRFDLESLATLAKILSAPDIDKFLAPSPLYSDYKGPYIFPNSKPFEWLVSLLDTKDPEVLKNVSICFLGISAYESNGEWVDRLIPLIPKFIFLLNSPSRQHFVWILSNMCIDNSNTRDLILKQGVCQILAKDFDMHDWTLISCSATFLRSLFIHKEKLPDPKMVMPLWDVIVNRVLIEHFVPPIKIMTHVAEMIVRCINILVKYSDEYKISLIKYSVLFERILKYALTEDGLIQIFAAETLSTVAELKSTHSVMVMCIPSFVQLLNCPNASLREEGGLGLAHLAETPECLPLLCNDLVFNAITMQFENTDISSVLKQMYFTVNSIVISAYNSNMENNIFPIVMNRFMYRICQSLFLEAQPNLVSHSIQSLKCFAKWNLSKTREMMEDYDAMSRLDSLTNHINIEIQVVAEELLEILEQCNNQMTEDNC
jgi:hypothetical protein